jgi:hypothetical protein
MAAAIKALNAKIRSNKALDYFCSTRTLLYLYHTLRTPAASSITTRRTVPDRSYSRPRPDSRA